MNRSPFLNHLIGLAAALALSAPAMAVPIVINYTDSAGVGFNDPTLGPARRACIEAAAANWAARLNGTVPIQVNASMISMGGSASFATLGGAHTAFYVWNFTNSAFTNTVYSVAEGNQLAAEDLEPGAEDIDIQYNSDVDNDTVLSTASFNYATDGRLTISKADGAGKRYYNIDFYQTCLHELGHGLGFFSTLNQDGSYLQTSFPYPGIYDVYLATGPNADSPLMTSLSQSARATALVSNQLYFLGPNARAAAGGTNARIYAPTTYVPGSTRSHLDEVTYAGTIQHANLNELMTPILGSGVMHFPGPIVSGVFEDIGWTFTPYTPSDVAAALRFYAGLSTSVTGDDTRFHREGLSSYPAAISLLDVLRVARAAGGLDSNPYILGTP